MRILSKLIFLTTALLLTAAGVRAQYITDVMLIGGNKNETNSYKTTYQNQGWTLINKDLNEGAGGSYIYLLYKTNNSTGSSGTPITDFYIKAADKKPGSFTDFTFEGRTYKFTTGGGRTDFNNNHCDLNYDVGGKYIYLCYTKDNNGYKYSRAITNIWFNGTENLGVGGNGNNSTGYDLNNGAGGKYIYMHVSKAATTDPIEVQNEAELKEAITLDANIRIIDNITLTNVVDIYNPVTLTIDLYGHTIDRNLTASAGGSGHVLQIRGGANVTLKDSQGGGKLTGGFADQGGGVWIGSTSTFTMASGTITGCQATGNGGAIMNNGTLKLKGNPVISGNTGNGGANDIYLPSGKKITVTGAFTTGAHIGLTPADPTSVLSTDNKRFNPSVDPDDFFFISADPATYGVTLLDGELVQYQKDAVMDSYYIGLDGSRVDVPHCRKVSALVDAAGVKMVNGWYVVDANTTISNRIELAGVVNLILADGFTFKAKKGLHVPKGVTLHIWGQSDGSTDVSGFLEANADQKDYVAGIGESRSGNEGRDAEPSGEINIHGGKVMAYGGKYSPGIGGNFGQDITITGGLVNASGEFGAGIGCGYNSMTPRNITITGGTVVAFSTHGAGIGSGMGSYNHWGGEVPSDGTFNTIRITGGKVEAFSGNGAGIGGGSYLWGYDGCEGFVIIEGGIVRAGVANQLYQGDPDPYLKPQSIGHGGWSTETTQNPGFIRWHVESEIYPNAKVKAKKYKNSEYILVPAAQRIEALRWVGVDISPCDHPDGTPCPYCGITELILSDNADNSTAISGNNGKTMDVTFSGRTLWKDGSWNTICLPFDLPSLEGTPLEGATVKEMIGSTLTDGVLTLSFSQPTIMEGKPYIEAGRPYIVKWNSGDPIIKPTFSAVTIKNVSGQSVSTYADFVGTYKPYNVYSGSGNILYLGAEDKLFRATSDLNVNAFRGYFQLKNGTRPNAVRSVVMDFGETPETETIENE